MTCAALADGIIIPRPGAASSTESGSCHGHQRRPVNHGPWVTALQVKLGTVVRHGRGGGLDGRRVSVGDTLVEMS